MSIPTFSGSSINQSSDQKIQDIKDKTQLFLSKKLSPEFIKRVLKPGDSIDFNYEIVIGENGHPIPNKTKANTTNAYFNSKITRYLNILPKFKPAVASVTKKTYPYLNNTDAEFLVNDAYKLIPIYRINLSDIYKIDTNNKYIVSLYDSINKNTSYKQPIKNIVYFSTTNNKEITNIKVHTSNTELKKLVTHSIRLIESNAPAIYSKLKTNKNYTLNSSIQKEIFKDSTSFLTPDRHAVFKGCNEKLSNDKLKMCMSEKIAKLINKNFNTDLAGNLGLTGRQRIFMNFKIDSEGNVIDAKARATHPELRQEAIRVIKLIPKMQPATKDGTPVIVPYSIPLIFTIEAEVPREKNRPHNYRRY